MKANNARPLDVKRRGTQLLTGGAALYALAALALIFYYIAYPSAASFHSDCADTILWAKAAVDAKALFNPDFCYAAMLPFGGTMLMIPLVAIFGLGMTAQKLGMLLFTLLFFAAVWLLCRSLKFSAALSCFSIGSLAMVLAASAKLREIYYEHVIYYSISVAAICVLLSLYLRCTDPARNQSSKPSLALWGLMGVFCILLALDGMQVLALAAAPVLFAAGLELLGSREKLLSKANHTRLLFCGMAVLALLTGLLLLAVLSRRVQSGYANAYSTYAEPANWLENLQKFPAQWLLLFGSTIRYGLPMFSAESLINLVRLATAVLLAAVPFAALCFFKRFDRGTRLLLLTHLGLFGVIFFGYVCGLLSAANWRLSPLICTGLLICLACVRRMLPHLTARRFAVLGLCLCLMMSAISCREIAALERDGMAQNPLAEKIAALEAHGLTVGYATFWNAQALNVLSEDHLHLAGIRLEEDGIQPYYYQTYRSDFEPETAQQRCFLLLNRAEIAQAAETGALEKAAEVIDCDSFTIYIFNAPTFLSA